MKKYVALLRGINVGGNHKVEMSRLKKVFEALGALNVSTYINSGNVIFESQTVPLVETIEKALEKTFGFNVQVVLLDAKNIAKVVKAIPKGWNNDTEVRTDVLFLWDKYNKKNSLGLIVANPEVDRLKYVDGAIIWSLDRRGYNKTGMRKFIGTVLYKNMTARNVNTVRKLALLMK